MRALVMLPVLLGPLFITLNSAKLPTTVPVGVVQGETSRVMPSYGAVVLSPAHSGIAWDAPSEQEAIHQAMTTCRSGKIPRTEDTSCALKAVFTRGQCVALYSFAHEGSTVLKLAFGPDAETAVTNAMGICRNENRAEASTCALLTDTESRQPKAYCQ